MTLFNVEKIHVRLYTDFHREFCYIQIELNFNFF